jgi:hypothetical protein
MRGRKRHRKKMFTLFVGQPRLRQREREANDAFLASYKYPISVTEDNGRNHYTEEQLRRVAESATPHGGAAN